MDVLVFLSIYLFVNTAFALVAGFVWQSRGGTYTDGFWIGLFLSLLGLVIAAVARPPVPWTPERGEMLPPRVS